MIPVLGQRANRHRRATGGGSPSYTLGVASFAGSTTRSDFTGGVGFKFTLAAGKTIHSLGRRKLSGNSGVHYVILFDANWRILATGKVDLSAGSAGSDILDPLVSDLALPAGTYYLVTMEVSGGETWYETAPATPAAGVTIDSDAYQGTAGTGQFRNDYTGRLGYKITPSSNQTITHLGRYKLDPSATAAHTVRIATTGGVELGSVSVATSGQPTGMVYAALGTPIALTGGTSYYIVQDETSGGDPFWDNVDSGGVGLATGFTLDTGAYYDGSYHDYAKAWPVGFKFGSGTEGLASMTLGTGTGSAGQAYAFPQFEFY